MNNNFKLKPLALAVLLSVQGSFLVSFSQNSEAAEESESDSEVVEEVVQVTGYRASIEKALSDKRNAETIQDSIRAEDIGKSTDQNIAEALSRVTGVSLQEEDGVGTKISVRGAESYLNQVSLNGVALTSGISSGGSNDASVDQSVDLSNFSSDILSAIHVIKTPSADHDEGSLGANVILKTFKPLNVKDNRRSLEVQGRYNDYSENSDYKLAGAFSHKFLDDKLGWIITAADETQNTRTDSVTSDWQSPYQPVWVAAGRARDLNGNLTTKDQYAILRKTLGYSFNTSQRDRQTATTGLQWLPSESTDLQLDLSWSKQKVETDTWSMSVSQPVIQAKEGKDDNHADDPQQDWWVVDEANHTVVRSFNRHAKGAMSRALRGNETENQVATLVLRQELTDALVMDVTAGMSSTDYESLPNWTVGTANWNTLPNSVKNNTPTEDLELVGYDCSTGKCQMSVGQTNVKRVAGGNNNNADNIAYNGFAPTDLYGNHLGYTAQYYDKSKDKNQSLFLDFDWDIDRAGLAQVEFGIKGSRRDLDVYSKYTYVKDAEQETRFDPDTGQLITGDAPFRLSMSDIIDPTAGSELPVKNFMNGLIATDSKYDQSFLNGWATIDPVRAIDKIFDKPNTVPGTDDSASRKITQTNGSAYAKLNFEYLDERLKGNIGLRYVRTEIDAESYSSIRYFSKSQIFDVAHMLQTNRIADASGFTQDCPKVTGGVNQTTRLDGITGDNYETDGTGNEICSDSERFIRPEAGKVDIPYVDGVLNQDQSTWLNEPDLDRSWWWLFRHIDPSTTLEYAPGIAEKYGVTIEEVSQRKYKSTGEGSSNILLPSLNLSFQINDTMISRFAMSRTMARPKFSSLKPGFRIAENPWKGQSSSAFVTNPALQPLKSDNLDLAYEWYFAEGAALSATLFFKKMKDFEEQVTDFYHWADWRAEYNRDQATWDEVSRRADESKNALNSDCMPARTPQDGIKDPLNVSCSKLLTKVVRNGAEASTKGLELGYSQTYDFLPGVWAGLGANINYTFADSESKAEILEGTGNELKALPQAYTPRNTLNTTFYWEKFGHQLRLTHRYQSVQLINRNVEYGANWMDDIHKLDFSASWAATDNLLFSIHALNLTDHITRTFFTSTKMELGKDEQGNAIILDEGNAMKDDVDTSRTVREYKTGRQFRLSARYKF